MATISTTVDVYGRLRGQHSGRSGRNAPKNTPSGHPADHLQSKTNGRMGTPQGIRKMSLHENWCNQLHLCQAASSKWNRMVQLQLVFSAKANSTASVESR